MPFSSSKRAVTVREADPEALPISTPRYFSTLHMVAGAPAPQDRSFLLLFWSAGAPATTHRVVLTSLTFRAQIEGVSVHPTVTQMMPQTRHYVDQRLFLINLKICSKIMMLSREFAVLTVDNRLELSYFREIGLCMVPYSRRILFRLKVLINVKLNSECPIYFSLRWLFLYHWIGE